MQCTSQQLSMRIWAIKGFHGIFNSYYEKPIRENVYKLKAKQSPAAFQNNYDVNTSCDEFPYLLASTICNMHELCFNKKKIVKYPTKPELFGN